MKIKYLALIICILSLCIIETGCGKTIPLPKIENSSYLSNN